MFIILKTLLLTYPACTPWRGTYCRSKARHKILMELLEALLIALVGAVVTTSILIVSTKRMRRVWFHGSFVFKLELDDSGKLVLKEVSVDTVPREITETLKQKAISMFKPLDITLKKHHVAVIALALFLIYLAILLYLY